MLGYIYESLFSFRKVFSHHRAWLVFVMIVLGFIGSSEMLGVSSFCRFWFLDTQGYHTLLHFFRSSAWNLNCLLEHWFVFVLSQDQAFLSQERFILIGDHTYVPKEGRRMPGVVTLKQDSQTQSKPSYFKGQCWGALALGIGSFASPFALPLNLRIHQGFVQKGQNDNNSPTMCQSMVLMAIEFALKTGKPVVLVLDAYFSTGSVFLLARSIYLISIQKPLVEIVVRAKKNYVAYFQANPEDYIGIGRPREYGEEIHVMEVFDHLYLFQKIPVRIYGHLEEIFLFSVNLMWKPTHGLIRFVFAKTSRGSIVLMCTNLKQDPIAAIELYCLRTRIETMFEMLKQLLHIFHGRFWSKKMPKHSRKPKSNQTLQAPKLKDIKTAQACWEATERFVNLGAIALGLLQLISLQFSEKIWKSFDFFLRTRSRQVPSERTTKMVMAHLLVKDFLHLAPSATMREIRDKVLKGKVERQLAQQAQNHENQAA